MLRRRGLIPLVCSLLLFAPTLDVAEQAPASNVVKILDGTVLRLALLDSLSSATNQVDDPVHFEVVEDVKVGEVVAIPEGSTASGHVVEVEPKRLLGRSGKLNFSVDFVKAADGSNVRLRAKSTRKGEEQSGTLLAPLFMIIRGKDVNIPKGTQFNAYVDGDREITLPNSAPAPAAASPTANPAPAAATAPAPAAQAAPEVSAEDLTTAVVKSDPPGADVTIDGKYMGSTPSTVRLAPGDHTILLEKAGFKPWQRTMAVNPGGIVTIDATLAKQE
jgi:hypothetical protein